MKSQGTGSMCIFIIFVFFTSCRGTARLHPKAVKHNSNGVKHLKEGDYLAAKASFLLALEYNHDFSEAYNNLGVVSMRVGDEKAAVEYFNEAVRLNPDFADAWNNIGVIERKHGNEDDAEQAFRKALESNPASVEARLNLSSLLIDQRRYDEAEMEIMKAIETGNTSCEIKLVLIELGIKKGDLARVSRRIKSITNSCSYSPVFWYLSAVFHLKIGLVKRARNELMKADELLPDESLWLKMGYTHALAGNNERAVFYFKKILERNPQNYHAAAGLILQYASIDENKHRDEIKQLCGVVGNAGKAEIGELMEVEKICSDGTNKS